MSKIIRSLFGSTDRGNRPPNPRTFQQRGNEIMINDEMMVLNEFENLKTKDDEYWSQLENFALEKNKGANFFTLVNRFNWATVEEVEEIHKIMEDFLKTTQPTHLRWNTICMIRDASSANLALRTFAKVLPNYGDGERLLEKVDELFLGIEKEPSLPISAFPKTGQIPGTLLRKGPGSNDGSFDSSQSQSESSQPRETSQSSDNDSSSQYLETDTSEFDTESETSSTSRSMYSSRKGSK